jgi:hypothetical protein
MRNGKPPVGGLRSGLGKEQKPSQDLGGLIGQTMGSNTFTTKTINTDHDRFRELELALDGQHQRQR